MSFFNLFKRTDSLSNKGEAKDPVIENKPEEEKKIHTQGA